MNTKQYRIIKKVLVVLPFYVFTFLPFTVSAQTFTQRIQQQKSGNAALTIHQSDSIDELVNSAPLGPSASPSAPAPVPSTSAASPSASSKTTVTPHSTAGDDENKEPAPVDLTKKIMRNAYKVNGYRVQAFAGGNSRKDRQQAEQTGNSIKASFPDTPVYVHFYSPRWICRVGNYRTYEEAHQMLISLRKMGFSQATIVKGKITVQY